MQHGLEFFALVMFVFTLHVDGVSAQVNQPHKIERNQVSSNPDIIVQGRTDADARFFLVQQMYNILEKSTESKNLTSQSIDLSKSPNQKDILVPLILDKLDPKIGDALKVSLGIELGNPVGPLMITDEERALIKNGDFNNNLLRQTKFLNRVILQIRLNKIAYKIFPEGLVIDQFTTSQSVDNEINFNANINLSKIQVEAQDICIRVLSFQKKISNPKQVEVVPSELNCSPESVQSTTSEVGKDQARKDFIFNIRQQQNVERESASSAVFLRNVKVTIQDTFLEVSEKSPLSFNVDFSTVLGDTGKFKLFLHEDTSLKDEANLNDSFSIKFKSANSVQWDGLAGFSILGKSINFYTPDLQYALVERKKEIIQLIMEPIKQLIETQIANIKTNPKVVNGLDLSWKMNPLEILLNQIDTKVDTEGNNQLNFLGLGLDVVFPGVSKQLPTDESEVDAMKVHNDLFSRYLDRSVYPERRDDIVISLSEDFFNDAIEYGIQKMNVVVDQKVSTGEMKKINFNVHDLRVDFNPANKLLEYQNSGEFVFADPELNIHEPILTGCIGYQPENKKLLKMLLKLLAGRKQGDVRVPILAYTEVLFDTENIGENPSFNFNITEINTNHDFLTSQPDGCDVAKYFDSLIANVAKKQIQNKFNIFNTDPIVKIEFPALTKLVGRNAVRVVMSPSDRRLDIIISLSNLKIVEIYELVQMLRDPLLNKMIISYPKADKLKSSRK